jgi:hypothetical protein
MLRTLVVVVGWLSGSIVVSSQVLTCAQAREPGRAPES